VLDAQRRGCKCHGPRCTWCQCPAQVHVYAYAPPNTAALEALLARSPLLELGAGTGYWARLLRGAGADVLALDIAPPGPAAAAANTYHGRVPAVTEVQRLGSRGCWIADSTPFKHHWFVVPIQDGRRVAC
jgi:protein-L-isoaspartate O-methyltransferase